MRISASMLSMAAEKAIKAIYQHYGKSFRYAHDLDELITGLQNEGIIIPGEVRETTLLAGMCAESPPFRTGPCLPTGRKGHNINETTLPGSPALWAGSFIRFK
jgi:hypothetical protein